jgi:hypothetical protein
MRNFKWLFILPLLMVGSLASAQTAPSLNFDINWNEWSSPSPLLVATTAKVNYDANRLSQCRGTTNTGGPAWSITGYYSINGGPVQSFWVAGHSSAPNPPAPSIYLSQRGGLSMWFQVTNLWGCNAWDSNYGNNYSFNIN